MPETLIRVVNGQVLSSRLLHASRSISSFTPAAAIDGAIGLTATAGSFCLFCANVVVGLAFVTSVSDPYGVAAASPATTPTARATAAAVTMSLLMCLPLFFRLRSRRDSNCDVHSIDGLPTVRLREPRTGEVLPGVRSTAGSADRGSRGAQDGDGRLLRRHRLDVAGRVGRSGGAALAARAVLRADEGDRRAARRDRGEVR